MAKITFILKMVICIVTMLAIYQFALPDWLKIKDYSIQLSALPQSELWGIKQAQIIKDKAVPYGFIKDDAAFIALVKQACQWDKNAMMVYSDYLMRLQIAENWDASEDDFNAFMKIHKDQIVDKQGRKLKCPDIVESNDLLYEKLAESGYPRAAFLEATSIGKPTGEMMFPPLSDEDRQKYIRYLDSALAGGYHAVHSLLGDMFLFPDGDAARGQNCERCEALNPLTDYRPELGLKDIQQALNEYNVVAEHGGAYGMLRLAEAWHHGIGVTKDNDEAYFWGEMALMAHAEYQKRQHSEFLKGKDSIRHREQRINIAARELLEDIHKEIPEPRWHKLNAMVNKHLSEIITWDYYPWADDIDPVPPKP